MKDRCKNITLATTPLRLVIISSNSHATFHNIHCYSVPRYVDMPLVELVCILKQTFKAENSPLTQGASKSNIITGPVEGRIKWRTLYFQALLLFYFLVCNLR